MVLNILCEKGCVPDGRHDGLPVGTHQSPEVLGGHGDVVINVAGHLLRVGAQGRCHVVPAKPNSLVDGAPHSVGLGGENPLFRTGASSASDPRAPPDAMLIHETLRRQWLPGNHTSGKRTCDVLSKRQESALGGCRCSTTEQQIRPQSRVPPVLGARGRAPSSPLTAGPWNHPQYWECRRGQGALGVGDLQCPQIPTSLIHSAVTLYPTLRQALGRS